MAAVVTLLVGVGIHGPSRADEGVAVQPEPLNYANAAYWVCRPGAPCDDDLTATELRADGSTRLEVDRPATAPRADCFYVYPTVSQSPGLSAAPAVTLAERRAVRQQVERFAGLCRLFVPFYRQITVASLQPDFPQPTPEASRASGRLAEADVLAAWDDYMAHDNGGRPVVLIGHSQGAFMVIRLLQKRIDGQAAQRQLVSAIIPGAGVNVPQGRQVGGTFKSIPPCRSDTQIGCVIAFNTVRAERALPETMTSRFPGQEQVCTNPAALAGGPGLLKPYLSTAGETIIPALTAPQGAWTRDGRRLRTPFVTTPGLYVAECRADEHGALLAVSTRLGPRDHRTGALTGDWLVEGAPEPTMGLHLIDMNLTQGNLLDDVRRQIASLEAGRTIAR